MTLPARTATMGWDAIWQTVSDPRVVASYKLSVGAALVAAGVNAVFGLIVAWVLARYRFPGKRIVDAFIDLPFALPTAVAGITLTTLYAPNGWLGRAAREVRHQGGVHAVGHHDRARVHRAAVRRAHAAAGHRGSRRRDRRSGHEPRRKPHVRADAHHPAVPVSGMAHRFRAGVRARGRRIRIGRLHFRQHADADGNCAAADHHQARAVRLRRRNGHRRRHAADFVHAAADRQRAPGLEQPEARRTDGARATGRTRDPKQGPDRAGADPMAADRDRAGISAFSFSRCRSPPSSPRRSGSDGRPI